MAMLTALKTKCLAIIQKSKCAVALLAFERVPSHRLLSKLSGSICTGAEAETRSLAGQYFEVVSRHTWRLSGLRGGSAELEL
jgi:hypothetical protein